MPNITAKFMVDQSLLKTNTLVHDIHGYMHSKNYSTKFYHASTSATKHSSVNQKFDKISNRTHSKHNTD